MKLHSLVIGDGDQHLIILHGFLGMGNNWKSYALDWAKTRYKVHLIDQRNHGRSFWSDEFNYDVLSLDIYQYMRDFNISSAIILGHSMGGKTAMNFALNYHEMVSKLIIVDISPREYLNKNQYILDALGSIDFDSCKSRKEIDNFLSLTISEPEFRSFLLKNLYWKTPEKLALRMNIDVLKKNDSIYKSISSENTYNGLSLFVSGEMSDYIVDEDKSLIKNLFPQADIVSIKNAGHWVQVENKTDFKITIQQFLKL